MSNSSDPVIVDDFSGDKALDFIGDWTHLYNYPGTNNNTASYTIVNGSSIVFTFNGTAVGVAGTVLPLNAGQKSPTSVYTLDDSPPVTFTAPSNATEEIPDSQFFVRNFLTAGVHKLVINITYVETHVPYLLDYVEYLPPVLASSSSLSINAPSQTGPLAIPSFTGAPQQSSSKTPVGAIVGGTIGGVALLVFTALGMWFFCRRRARTGAYFYESANPADMLTQEIKNSPVEAPVDPLQVPQPFVQAAPASSSNVFLPGASNVFLPGVAPYASQVSVGTSGKGAPPPPEPVPAAVYHADSGVRFTPGASGSQAVPPVEIPDDVPPQYTED